MWDATWICSKLDNFIRSEYNTRSLVYFWIDKMRIVNMEVSIFSVKKLPSLFGFWLNYTKMTNSDTTNNYTLNLIRRFWINLRQLRQMRIILRSIINSCTLIILRRNLSCICRIVELASSQTDHTDRISIITEVRLIRLLGDQVSYREASFLVSNSFFQPLYSMKPSIPLKRSVWNSWEGRLN